MAKFNCYLCDCSAIKSTFTIKGSYSVYCPGCGHYGIGENAIQAIIADGFPTESKISISEQIKKLNTMDQNNVVFIDYSEGVLRAICNGNISTMNS